MRTRILGLPLLDVALALTLCAVKITLLATGVQAGSGVFGYVTAPLWTLPFAWRRVHPVAVAAVVMSADLAELAAVGYHNSIVALAAFMLASYSVGAYAGSVWRMVAGMWVTLVAGLVSEFSSGRPHSAAGLLSTLGGDAALLFVPFCVGLALRQQRLRAQALERLAVHLDREREESARAAVTEERARIARELHDEVAHAMSVIAVQADAAEGALAHDPALVAPPLVAIRQTAREALTDMRRVLGALGGVERAPEPGLARVDALVEQARASGLAVDLRVEGEPVPLPAALDLTAYRVVQEGLTNVRKHSAARHVDIVLRYAADRLDLELADDGDARCAGDGSGRGLAGIRERVTLLGGCFAAGPRTRGFAVQVWLPLT